ncbi:MAG: hypothetical protein R3C68_05580 [Myxococcota bacterium]
MPGTKLVGVCVKRLDNVVVDPTRAVVRRVQPMRALVSTSDRGEMDIGLASFSENESPFDEHFVEYISDPVRQTALLVVKDCFRGGVYLTAR